MANDERIVGADRNILCVGDDDRKEHYNLSKTIWLGHCNCSEIKRKSKKVVP